MLLILLAAARISVPYQRMVLFSNCFATRLSCVRNDDVLAPHLLQKHEACLLYHVTPANVFQWPTDISGNT